jgi:ubiquinone/menaquinone biosynthesis C-methylase UbiE
MGLQFIFACPFLTRHFDNSSHTKFRGTTFIRGDTQQMLVFDSSFDYALILFCLSRG